MSNQKLVEVREAIRLANNNLRSLKERFSEDWKKAKMIKDEAQRDKELSILLMILELFIMPEYEMIKTIYESIIEAAGHRPDTFWSNTFDFLEYGDEDAGNRLIRQHFPKKAIFYSAAWSSIKSRFMARANELENKAEAWKKLTLAALLLAIDDTDTDDWRKDKNPLISVKAIEDLKNSAIYEKLMKGMNLEIQRDLLDGTTRDSDEYKKVENLNPNIAEYSLTKKYDGTGYIENSIGIDDYSNIKETIDWAFSFLTIQEQKIMNMKAEGYLDKEIAEKLNISPALVRKKLQRIRNDFNTSMDDTTKLKKIPKRFRYRKKNTS